MPEVLDHKISVNPVWLVSVAIIMCLCSSCGNKEKHATVRPLDVWAFRSVLDKQPRMLTLALDSECYAAYDLERCTLYKLWKGGVSMEGAPYTDKKNVQPTSWGKDYLMDSLRRFGWVITRTGREIITIATS